MTFQIILLIFIILFGIYILWIRPWQLRWGAIDEEVARAMPGDEIVAKATFDATRAVTIHASPEHIYPWIRQIGITRAGWYSYDLLDNLARPSARQILPQFQETFVGQVIPMSPDGKQGLFVHGFKDNEWILWWDKKGATTWCWGIYPAGESGSRLVTRVRTQYHWLSFEIIFNLLVEFADIIMMRKCLLNIRERAETMARHDQARK